MSDVEYIIETTDLSKSYGPHLALENLNLKVRQGATGLLGPNGAGTVSYTHLTLPTR